MLSVWNSFLNLLPFLISLALVGWLLWRWLKSSDEPQKLIVRWLASAVVLGGVFLLATRARDEFSKLAAVLIAAVAGLVLTLIWRQKLCDFVGDLFGSLLTGGNQQADPAPLYSIAQARRKQGRYGEALAEVESQLARFPTDFSGWMLLAEIYAEDLKDLASAQLTVGELVSQPGHAPKNIAYALNREADWHLKLAQDRDGARAALERIVELLPNSQQALQAMQRIAHLAPPEMLAEQQERRRVPLEHRVENLGLRDEPLNIKPAEEDPAVTVANCVKQLEEFPFDADAREKLALLYARHYQRLDLATDQLEQLIAFPNQPARQVVHWLNLLADLQLDLGGDPVLARQTVHRIVELYPDSAAGANARTRLAHLNLELRPKQQSRAIKLGSYEQNIGLKSGRPRGTPPSSSVDPRPNG